MSLGRSKITNVQSLPEKNDTSPCGGDQRPSHQLNTRNGNMTYTEAEECMIVEKSAFVPDPAAIS